MNTTLRRLWIAPLTLCALLWCGAGDRGVVTVDDAEGKPVELYAESHALLIGISHYTNGWSDLRSVPGELEEVRAVLTEQGFDVTLRLNLDAAKLRSEIVAFIDRHGRAPQNRLLFFFSGHGHTLTKAYGDELGYIVPADAPLPSADRQGFLSKAVSMDQMLTWARDIDAKHALFAFDSCFAGSIFEQMRSEGERPPPLILEQTSKPVRMFITAGGAGDPVPAKSTFTPSFVDALRGRKGDLDHDGYVTGMELGFYLQGEVRKFVAQTPQYGKIREISLARGDFVFALKAPRQALPSVTVEGGTGPGQTNARLRISVDGKTVLDTRSGFMWMRQDFWTIERGLVCTFSDAKTWATKMNKRAYGGYSDWRLPSVDEYRSLDLEHEPYERTFEYDITINNYFATDSSGFGTCYIKLTDLPKTCREAPLFSTCKDRNLFSGKGTQPLETTDRTKDYTFSVRLIRRPFQ